MSLKIYNKETGRWEKQTSMLATSIEVIDVENKFESETSSVENCLSELKDDFTKVKADIKYIKEKITGHQWPYLGGQSKKCFRIFFNDFP